MIVAALVDYYKRLEADPESRVPPYGWSLQKIGFVVILESDGSLHDVTPPPTAGGDGAPRLFLVVPGQSKPSGSGINPCFLWDTAAYLLGLPPEGKEANWAWKRFDALRAAHLEQDQHIDDAAFSAVCKFLKDWNPSSAGEDPNLAEKATGFGVFRLRGAREYVHERSAVVEYWNRRVERDVPDGVVGISLVSGRREVLTRLHEPKIKGVRASQTSGALLASFNLDAFESYGKQQGLNAPVGQRDAFRYCTALNLLLGDPRRRVQVGDATTVFWSEKPNPVEDITGAIIGGTEDEEAVRRVDFFLESLRRGVPNSALEDVETPFYLLGLAPNAARLSVRFWLQGTVATFAERLARHANALELQGAPKGYSFPSIRQLVSETAPPKNGWADQDRIPPVLAGETVRSVLGGLPYPRSLLVRIVERIRIEGFADPEKRKDWLPAMHRRASIVKACLTAGALSSNRKVPMTLDKEHPETSYQLGRLFAVIEKTQSEALGGELNASVRERYLGAASATPSTVFPRVLRLHAHHLRKLEHPGRRVQLERLVGSICERIDASHGFPHHLSIEEQGLFFLGYYQQRQDFFTSKRDAEPEVAEPANA